MLESSQDFGGQLPIDVAHPVAMMEGTVVPATQGSIPWNHKIVDFVASLRNPFTRWHRYGHGGKLDSVDVQILKELLQGQAAAPVNAQFRQSYEAIARRVGVDEETVRNRVKGYHRSGFIQDWRTIVNPNLLRSGDLARREPPDLEGRGRREDPPDARGDPDRALLRYPPRDRPALPRRECGQ